MTDAVVTIVSFCLTTLALAVVVSTSHKKLMASLSGSYKGLSAAITLFGNHDSTPVITGGGAYGPLVWLPLWKQAGGLLPDGNPDPEQYNDCGETCAAMVIAAVRGVSVHPGDIRQQLGGDSRTGLTTADDLVQALKDNSVASHTVSMNTMNAWSQLGICYGQAKTALVIGYWLSLACLHWMLLVDKLPGAFVFIDPWTGTRHTITQSQWEQLYIQSMVVVDDRLSYDASRWPTPGTGVQA